MKALAATVMSLSLATSSLAQTGAPLKITRNGAQPSASGSADNFTGSVRVDSLFRAEEPARVSGGHVTFDAGAHTAWHTHPLGQTLIVTQGLGLVQRWGGPVQEIHPGDIVWIPPGEKHWHGASPTHGMGHYAIAEQLNGKSVDWLEKLAPAEYVAAHPIQKP